MRTSEYENIGIQLHEHLYTGLYFRDDPKNFSELLSINRELHTNGMDFLFGPGFTQNEELTHSRNRFRLGIYRTANNVYITKRICLKAALDQLELIGFR